MECGKFITLEYDGPCSRYERNREKGKNSREKVGSTRKRVHVEAEKDTSQKT